MRWVIPACVLAFVMPIATSAQSLDQPSPHAAQVAVGGGLFGGAGLGHSDANLRANATVQRDYRLFSTATRLASTAMVEARVGIGLSQRLQLEWHVMFARPELRTSVQGDVEGGAAVTAVERISESLMEGSLLVTLDKLRLGRRTVPFVTAGAGYLRQHHEETTLIDQGQVYHAGGGIRHWLFVRDRGLVRAAGLRADARLYLLAGGVAVGDSTNPHGAISGSLIVAF